jgi:hypothetical protein
VGYADWLVENTPALGRPLGVCGRRDCNVAQVKYVCTFALGGHSVRHRRDRLAKNLIVQPTEDLNIAHAHLLAAGACNTYDNPAERFLGSVRLSWARINHAASPPCRACRE